MSLQPGPALGAQPQRNSLVSPVSVIHPQQMANIHARSSQHYFGDFRLHIAAIAQRDEILDGVQQLLGNISCLGERALFCLDDH